MADNVIVRVPEQQFIRGEDGYSPEVTIENIDHGHSVNITDRDHPTGQSFNVMDGDSAYEQAVAGGYTGTEAQFNEELASFKELSDETKEAAPFYAEYFVTTKEEIEAAINYKRQIFLRPNQYSSYFAQFAGSFWYIESGISGTGYRFITTIGASQTVFELKNSWSFRTYNLNAPAERAEAAAATALTRMNSADASAQAAAGSAGDASTAATTATTKAGEASNSATAADGSAKDSEAYAIGKRGGTDVGSTDPAYHNNAKYYAQQAALIVDDVEQVMTSTAVGPASIVTFDASVADMPLKGLTVNIEPVQSGSGDPSPENVRSITGWTGCNIYRSGEDMSNPTAYAITFPTEAGTVYGGTLDVVNGVLKVTHAITTVSAKTWRYESNYTRFNAGFTNIVVGKYGTRKVPFMCSAFQPIDDGRSLTNVPNNSIYGAGTSATVFIKTDTVSTVEDFISTYGNVQILYELAEPLVYDIADIHDVLTLLGTNNIWADTGDVTVTYGAYLETVKNYANRAEDAQEAAEQAQEAAEAVLESIPEDYTTLSDDVDDLKSAINTESTPFNWTKIATRSYPLGWRTGRYRASNGTYNNTAKNAICTGVGAYIASSNVREIKITAPSGYKVACCEYNESGVFVQTIGSTASGTAELQIQTMPNYSYKFTVGEFAAGTVEDYLTSEFINSITLIEYYYIESVKDTKHLNILLFGNSYGADSFAYVPFILKKYGITTNIHFYYRGSGSVDRLVAEWEDDTATGLDDFGSSHVRRYTHIDTRYETKWEGVTADFHPSPKSVLELANTDTNIGQWDIIVLFTGSRSQSFTKAPGNGDPRKGAEPYIRQAINLINASYTKPYKLAWFEDYTSFDGYSGNTQQGYPPITPQEMDNRVGVLKSTETIMGAEPFDMVIPAGAAVFNARTNASLASTNLSVTGNLWCSDKIHLQAGIPNYIANCAVVQSIFNKFFPELSILNDDTRITDTLISDYACPFISSWCGSVLDSTDLLYDLGQKAAVMACKYPYDITPIYLPTDATELELFDSHSNRYWADSLITQPSN